MVSTSSQEVRLFLACRFVISVQLRQRPDHAGVNAALFLQLGPPSTLILPDNGASQTRSSNGRNLEMSEFRFRVDGKHFGNRGFRKRWRHDNHVISVSEFSSNLTNPKWLVIVAFFKFLRGSMDGKRKISVFKSSGVVWTEKVKSPFLNSSGMLWTRTQSHSGKNNATRTSELQ